MSLKNNLERLQEINFHEAALWSAITFVKYFDPNKSIKEIIRSYKAYLQIDEDVLSDEVAAVTYHRTIEKVKRLKRKRFEKGAFPSELKEQIDSLKNVLSEFERNLKDGHY
jgi:hypothetical protein